jgi:hypothetical protein
VCSIREAKKKLQSIQKPDNLASTIFFIKTNLYSFIPNDVCKKRSLATKTGDLKNLVPVFQKTITAQVGA